jgi:hypothetical protein
MRYVRHLVDAAGADRSLILTTDETLRSEEFAEYIGCFAHHTVALPNGANRRLTGSAWAVLADSSSQMATATSFRYFSC